MQFLSGHRSCSIITADKGSLGAPRLVRPQPLGDRWVGVAGTTGQDHLGALHARMRERTPLLGRGSGMPWPAGCWRR